jgi:hypothetical protein
MVIDVAALGEKAIAPAGICADADRPNPKARQSARTNGPRIFDMFSVPHPIGRLMAT